MSKFQKLSQINKDIELLENAGKIKAAEVLHQKFIKEAQQVNNIEKYQARPGNVNQRIVYPGQGNAFERGDNFARSERGGVGTLYNFKGLEPEMEPVRVQTSPGNWTIQMRPKGNIGNPYATRPNDPFSNIPGYNEFLKFKPSASETRDFVDNKGTVTPAGQAIFNAKANAVNTPSAAAPANLPQPQTSAAVPAAAPAPAQVAPPVVAPATTPVATPQGNTNPAATQGTAIPKLQERIDHYNKKIQDYKNTTDPKRKSEMLMYLSQYIENNYRDGLLDSQSYKNLMTALGEKGLS
jgi:hypothetical protein